MTTTRPNLSHAWARTIEGAQGGTWEAVHLLGTASLDALSGYVGQSRGRRPTRHLEHQAGSRWSTMVASWPTTETARSEC